VILALGVRPDTTLAKAAGVEMGALGGIRVDEQMRTSDSDLFAVGDAVEERDVVTGEWVLIALAGPATRQGPSAADVIAGRDSWFRGTQSTAAVGLFGSGSRGPASTRRRSSSSRPLTTRRCTSTPTRAPVYYPGAKPIAMKVSCHWSADRTLHPGSELVGHDPGRIT
jgi:NADPH-dependent 2,4-dienoyl-CoA reductase/sulfur reductase-like enzyme